ncbi:MAG: DNA topoisomerase 1 [Peltula sp. TS41687]|nr:MAG: DNA topoisomerase 1 [Peltula sp. TS41687]
MTSSDDDDVPLAKGHRMNGSGKSKLSHEKIASSVDKTLDRENNGEGNATGISLKKGPYDEMDIDETKTNGVAKDAVTAGKRKSRQSLSNGKTGLGFTGSDDDKPSKKRRRMSKKVNGAASGSESEDQPIIAKKLGSKKSEKQTETLPAQLSDADVPLVKKLAQTKKNIEKEAEKEAKAIRKADNTKVKAKAESSATKKDVPPKKKMKKDESDDEETIPTKKRASRASASTAGKRQSGKAAKQESDDEDDEPLRRKTPAKGAAAKTKSATGKDTKKTAKGKAAAKEESAEDAEAAEQEEEEYRWWEAPNKGDGSIKWKTLEHAGVVFPPPYEPLPANVKMRYEGEPVTLEPEAEEVAGFFGAMLNSTHNVENPTFIKNFFHDFQEVLKKSGGAKGRDGKAIRIKEFSKCDFTPIFDYYEAKRAEKKALPAAEKKQLKAEKDAAEAPYIYCMWDGRKEKVGNFRVEPPGLFRGRGEHPKTGHLKKRVMPEQITINIGKDATVPAPPEGHKWKEVKHDQTGTWLAMWQENINSAYKYVMLAANSAIKGQSDYNKFEKARELKKHIDRIRKDYEKGLKAELMADRQKATAVYLIDKFALRAGNEKGEDEADTVGCCSLKFEHVTLKPPNTVIFDFLGKDSIRFYNEVEVDEQVFKNLKIFKKAPKKDGDEIFDRLKTAQLNQHLSSYMPGLSAKVFRTYNASYTMSKLLKDMKSEGSIADKIKDYNDANREVAILCNHKRTVPTSHANQMEKMTEKIKGLKYQKWRIKQMMLNIDDGLKKKRGAKYFRLDDDMDEEWVVQHQAFLVQEQRQKIEKKFQKDNEKLVADGQKEMKAKELEERMQVADDLAKQFAKENRTQKIEAEGRDPTVEKLEANLEKLDKKIENMETQAEIRESNKEVALGTSKINYIDPRLTVVFSKKFNVPIERFFSKTLREKFDWAIKSVDENWEF